MTPSDLLEAAAVLGFVGLLAQPKDDAEIDALRALRLSLRDFALTLALAALLGAGLLHVIPAWRLDLPYAMTLDQLNQRIVSIAQGLQMAWYLPLLAALGWVALALAGFASVAAGRAHHLGNALGWTLKLKALATIVAMFAVTATGLQQRAATATAEAQEQVERLQDLRIRLATEARQASQRVVAEVLAQAMAQTLPASAGPSDLFERTATAYAVAQVELQLPPLPKRADARAGAGATALQRAIASRLPDLSAASIEAAQRRLQPIDGGDAKAQLLGLALDAALDQHGTSSLRDTLLSIENPLLGELMGALIDPLIAQPLRQLVTDAAVVAAVSAAGASDARAALRQKASAWWRAAPPRLRNRLRSALQRAQAATTGQPGVELGHARWVAMRASLAAGVAEAGAQRVGDVDGFAARDALRRFNGFWGALDVLLVTPRARGDLAEAAAGRYMMGSDRDQRVYAALWASALERQAGLWQKTTVSSRGDTRRQTLLRYYAALSPALHQAAQSHFEVGESHSGDGHTGTKSNNVLREKPPIRPMVPVHR